jgi:hypothetical protein
VDSSALTALAPSVEPAFFRRRARRETPGLETGLHARDVRTARLLAADEELRGTAAAVPRTSDEGVR